VAKGGSITKSPAYGGGNALKGKGGRRSTARKGFMSTPAQAPHKGMKGK
jgi:hypothetical protein